MLGFFDKYPYTDFHDLNLDWLLKAVRDLASHMEGWEAANTIHYAGDFDITKQYQAWSIVLDNNIGYISKKPVPAGIAVTNTEYWEEIADFTALIGDLGNRVETLEEYVDVINKTLFTSPRNIICVGDSYGRGLSITGGAAVYNNGWPYYINERMHPAALYNLSVNQASFSPSNTASLRFGYQLEQFKIAHTTAECEAITDIIIAGGFNEIFFMGDDRVYSTADYCAKWTAEYIKQYFPYAKVYLGFIGRVPKMSNEANATIPNFTTLIQQYKDICANYGWTYLNGSEFSCHDYSLLSEDGIHFTQNGYTTIGARLVNSLVSNGNFEFHGSDGKNMLFALYTSAANNQIANPNISGIYNQMTSSGVQVFTTDTSLQVLFNNQAMDFGSEIKIAKYYSRASDIFNMFAVQYDIRINVIANVYKADNTTELFNAILKFKSNGELGINLIGGTGTETINGIAIFFDYIVLPYSNC